MKLYKTNDFKKGWFVGNFEPSLFKTDLFEVAVKEYKKGDTEASHYHKIATEYTIFNSGEYRMKDSIYKKGDILEISPGESTDFECVKDGTTTVVKIPCVTGDKYID